MHLASQLPVIQNDAGARASYDVPRAGLRVPPPAGAPTGAFVVVEMTVLVIVVALAMVSVIVASADEAGRDAGAFTTRPHAATGGDLRLDARPHPLDVGRVGSAQ